MMIRNGKREEIYIETSNSIVTRILSMQVSRIVRDDVISGDPRDQVELYRQREKAAFKKLNTL